MYYPFLFKTDNLRKDLINNRIYLPACWRGIEEKLKKDSYELYLKKYMFLLIIDQRYNLSDMKRMIKVIKKYI